VVTFGKSHLLVSGFSCFLLFTALSVSAHGLISKILEAVDVRIFIHTYVRSVASHYPLRFLRSFNEATLHLSACFNLFNFFKYTFYLVIFEKHYSGIQKCTRQHIGSLPQVVYKLLVITVLKLCLLYYYYCIKAVFVDVIKDNL